MKFDGVFSKQSFVNERYFWPSDSLEIIFFLIALIISFRYAKQTYFSQNQCQVLAISFN